MSKLTLRIRGETNYLSKLRAFVNDLAEKAGFDSSALGDIEFAVDEAATNIIRHAYDEDPDIPDERRIIEVEVNEIEKGIEIVLKDRAKPFNPENVPSPDLSKHVQSFKTSGLGVFAMKVSMDEISHRYLQGVGNEITMKKYLS